MTYRRQHKAPIPADRLTGPWIVVDQEHVAVAHNLFFCVFVVSPFRQDKRGLSREQLAQVELVKARLIEHRLAGRFPTADAYAFWLNLSNGGGLTPLDLEAGAGSWLRHHMRDHLSLTLSVPRPAAGPGRPAHIRVGLHKYHQPTRGRRGCCP